MKRIIFVLVLILLSNHFLLNAQGNKIKFNNAKIGITFSSFGSNDVFRINELMGATSYDSNDFYNIGITYIQGLNSCLEIETGFEYSRHLVVINPPFYPNITIMPRKASFSIINIPATLRINFLKYFFINSGLLLDIDVSSNSPIDSQSGIGAIMGIGLKYDWDNGVSAFVNPYSKIHSLLPLMQWGHHQRVWENGFRFGVTFKFPQYF